MTYTAETTERHTARSLRAWVNEMTQKGYLLIQAKPGQTMYTVYGVRPDQLTVLIYLTIE